VNIIDPSMGALMVAVKTELCDCYLVHMYVSPHMFISQKFDPVNGLYEIDKSKSNISTTKNDVLMHALTQ
jgi:hypothetical protein